MREGASLGDAGFPCGPVFGRRIYLLIGLLGGVVGGVSLRLSQVLYGWPPRLPSCLHPLARPIPRTQHEGTPATVR